MSDCTSETGRIRVESVRCPVCLQQYENSADGKPRSLHCGHSCCTGCLKKLQPVEQHIKCPICRNLTRLPQVVDNLPVNFAIFNVIDSLRARQGASASSMEMDVDALPASSPAALAGNKRKIADAISCQNCRNDAIWYCASCQVGQGSHKYCDSCWTDVAFHRDSKSVHKKQSIHDKPANCPMHPFRQMQWWCIQDQMATCDYCTTMVTGGHFGHECKELAAEMQAKTQELEHKMRYMQDLDVAKIDQLQRTVETIDRRGQALCNKVTEDQELLKAELIATGDIVIADIQRKQALRKASVQLILTEAKQTQDRRSEVLNDMNRLINTRNLQNTNPQLFVVEANRVLELYAATVELVATVDNKSVEANKLPDFHLEAACDGFRLFQATVIAHKALHQTLLELAACGDTRSSGSELVSKHLQHIGNNTVAGLREDVLQSVNDYKCLFCRHGVSEESLTRVLLHVFNFLEPNHLSDSTVEGRARTRGAVAATGYRVVGKRLCLFAQALAGCHRSYSERRNATGRFDQPCNELHRSLHGQRRCITSCLSRRCKRSQRLHVRIQSLSGSWCLPAHRSSANAVPTHRIWRI